MNWILKMMTLHFKKSGAGVREVAYRGNVKTWLSEHGNSWGHMEKSWRALGEKKRARKEKENTEQKKEVCTDSYII